MDGWAHPGGHSNPWLLLWCVESLAGAEISAAAAALGAQVADVSLQRGACRADKIHDLVLKSVSTGKCCLSTVAESYITLM